MQAVKEELGGCWTEDYWLRHCEGFRVEDADGEAGYVEEVLCDGGGTPIALHVAGRAGTVPVSAVEEVSPAHELITLGSAFSELSGS